MRFILMLSFLFLTIATSYGQNFKISARVTDSNNDKELLYANIMVIGHTIGTTSNSKGFFELTLPYSLKNDSIIISYVGYHSLVMCLNDFKGNSVKLKPQSINLNEVVIRPSKKKPKLLIVNKFKPKDCSIRYSPTKTDTDFWIPQRQKNQLLKRFIFRIKRNMTAIEK